MANNFRGRPMRIRWGASYVNAADLPSVDNAVAYSEPREGSEAAITVGGIEDAWTVGNDEFFEADFRYIPREDSLTPYRTVGWNGAAGLAALLKWARDKNVLIVHPDARNLAVSPLMNADADSDGVVDGFAALNGGAGSFTRALDATDGAQKIIMPAAAGNAAKFMGVSQTIYGIMPGDTLSFSVEARGTYTGGGGLRMYTTWYTSIGVEVLGGTQLTSSYTPGSYTRIGQNNRVAPATTAFAHVQCYVTTPLATDAVTGWFRNIMVERASSASSVFIDNPAYSAYLTDPMKGAPTLEPNKMRMQHVKLRSSTGTAWDGY